MIYEGGTYKHSACTDMEIIVTSILGVSEKSVQLVVIYKNSNMGIAMHSEPDQISIQIKDIHKWKKVK